MSAHENGGGDVDVPMSQDLAIWMSGLACLGVDHLALSPYHPRLRIQQNESACGDVGVVPDLCPQSLLQSRLEQSRLGALPQTVHSFC